MRAIVIVLDSVGIGHAPDAADYGDQGANTLGHLLERFPDLSLPALWSMGLGHAIGRRPARTIRSSFGRMSERSIGKDSMTGHWEMAGVILTEPLGLFTSFPAKLVKAIERQAGVRFIGNCPASGTQIIEDLGPRHLASGELILYTSADSVLQIAAHEGIVPLERLYEICRIARCHADCWRIGRVIARPFVGEPGSFIRTAGRHDFALRPPYTILNALANAGLPVQAVGKTTDLFGGSGIARSHPTASNRQGMQVIEEVWRQVDAGLVFANLVDFDTHFGHRRDPAGYAQALIEFDQWLAGFLPCIAPDDLLIITADHGNDPTFPGTDHTREQVPVLLTHADNAPDLGVRATFADVTATLARYFHLPPWPAGTPMIRCADQHLERKVRSGVPRSVVQAPPA